MGVTVVFSCISVAVGAEPATPPTIDGATFRVLRAFSGIDGRLRVEHLVQSADGTLFGANMFGGVADGGLVFSIRPDGSSFQVIHDFTNYTQEVWPVGLMLSSDGRLYGSTCRSNATFVLNTDGSDYRILRIVPVGDTSRAFVGPLVENSDGTLLGATEGIGGGGGGGIGRINKDGTGFVETHRLVSTSPYAVYVQPPLVAGPGGRFYGVSGNASQQLGGLFGALGQLFRVQMDGTGFEGLLDFAALGWTPTAPLLIGSDGLLYGLADAGNGGRSIVWRANADGGAFVVLKEFACHEEGIAYGKLLEGVDGRLYGTTSLGVGCTSRYELLVTGIFSLDKDGDRYAREWEEVYRPGSTNSLADLRLALLGRDGALYGSGQVQYGNLVRYQAGTVPTVPKVISVAPPMLAPEGSRIVLATAVRGAGPLSYQWSLDGLPLASATNAWLGIDSVQTGSYGDYSVTITNPFGATQSSFTLEAPEQLVLTLQHTLSHDLQLHIRGSANLEFGIEGSTDLRTWQPVSGGQLVDGQAVVSIPESVLGDHFFFRGRYLRIGVDDD